MFYSTEVLNLLEQCLCIVTIFFDRYQNAQINPVNKRIIHTISVSADVESLTFRQIYFTVAMIGKFMQNSKYKRNLIIFNPEKAKYHQ